MSLGVSCVGFQRLICRLATSSESFQEGVEDKYTSKRKWLSTSLHASMVIAMTSGLDGIKILSTSYTQREGPILLVKWSGADRNVSCRLSWLREDLHVVLVNPGMHLC